MKAFYVVAVGQFAALIGVSMTSVAMTVWAWKLTGTATALAAVAASNIWPLVLFSPFAGALVDRFSRKLMMMLADISFLVSTAITLALYLTGSLQVWHLCLLAGFNGVFQAFQFPAYSAAISLMVPKEQLSRASAMIGLAESSAGVLAPIAGSALLPFIGFPGVLIIALVAVTVGLGALLLVRVPQPARSGAGREAQGTVWREAGYGFTYIFARPSLLGLQVTFLVGNLLSSLAFTLGDPMVLARTGDNALALGAVRSAAAVGGVLAGLVLSTWGGPKRKVTGIITGWAGGFVLGHLLMGFGRSVPVWAAGMLASAVCGTLGYICNQAIWQRKVAPEVQGRVFAARLFIAQMARPVGTMLAGPLADRLLEPGMRSGGSLAGVFGGLVGTGRGSGMALAFVLTGVIGAVVVVLASRVKAIRLAETLLPDFDAVTPQK